MYYLYDYHTHSTNSTDGNNSVLELCQSAVSKGVKEIAITDHFEPMRGNESYKAYRPNAYWIDVLKAKYIFKNRLKIKMGVELGQPHQFQENSELLINSFPYDYVIGSVHKLSQGMDVSELNFSRITVDKLCAIYLEELKKLADWGKFDCIGHLDLVKRYSTDYYKTRITLFSQYDLLKDVLKALIQKGKGIEINTSGLRQMPKETMPGIDVLKLYRELGGEILTIGSDAHYAGDVGKGVIEATELAKEAGFEYINLFNNRQPEWKRITDKKSVYSFSQQLNIS